MLSSFPARLGVTAWLAGMAYLDGRRRQLPHWGTTVPLIILVCLRVGHAVWAWLSAGWAPAVADGLAIGLAFVAAALSDRWGTALPPALIAGGVVSLGSDAGRTTVATWLVVLGLAKAGIVGAGDAKVMMVLGALYPDPLLDIVWLAAGLLFGIIALVVRMKGAALFLLHLTLRDALALRFPARTGERGVLTLPLTPVLAVGTLAYLWLL